MLKSTLSSAIVVAILLAACRGGEARSDGRGIDAGTQGDEPQITQPSEAGVPVPTLQRTPPGNPGGAGDQTTGGTTGGVEPTVELTLPVTLQVTLNATAINIDARGTDAKGLDTAWEQIGQLDQGVPFRLTITEAELEAAILTAMQEQGYGSNITDLNVSLQNGQIGLSFTFMPPDHADRQVPASILYNASLDPNGNLVLTVASAEVGRVELPPEMLSAFDQALSQAISGAASSAEAEVTLTSLVIANGEMIIEGRIKQ